MVALSSLSFIFFNAFSVQDFLTCHKHKKIWEDGQTAKKREQIHHEYMQWIAYPSNMCGRRKIEGQCMTLMNNYRKARQ